LYIFHQVKTIFPTKQQNWIKLEVIIECGGTTYVMKHNSHLNISNNIMNGLLLVGNWCLIQECPYALNRAFNFVLRTKRRCPFLRLSRLSLQRATCIMNRIYKIRVELSSTHQFDSYDLAPSFHTQHSLNYSLATGTDKK
jgi:hypothetical protein